MYINLILFECFKDLFNNVFLILSYAGRCVRDYYDGNLGVEQHISSAGQPCLHTVRSKRDTWLRLWFETINFTPGNFVFVTLKESSGKIKMNWNLTSNDSTHVRNFDGVVKGNWFEIKQSSNVSFNLKFMSYSASKYDARISFHRCLVNNAISRFSLLFQYFITKFPCNSRNFSNFCPKWLPFYAAHECPSSNKTLHLI